MTNFAFPSGPIPEGQVPREVGLTKREYAAIAAMQALLSNPEITSVGIKPYSVAADAAKCADALLLMLDEPQE